MAELDPKHAPQAVYDLYDRYAHGLIDRRQFFEKLSAYAVGGLTLSSLAACVTPDYSDNKLRTAASDPAISVETFKYASPLGAGDMAGDLVIPAEPRDTRGGVLVIHENRGLNPHIKDVARRFGHAGYVAFAPDALYPLGGYPGNDDDGRALQRQRDRGEMLEDFVMAADELRRHPATNGTVAGVGFCFGGAMANLLAVRLPWLSGAVPFYGGWPSQAQASQVEARLLIHLAGLDTRVNAGWPAYEAALQAAGKDFTVHTYEGANHGFHNDTTGRFNADAAELAWARTLEFLDDVLA
ncbi:MAG: dienelactone hydrolase family protein [Pseudomonadota bacterium]